MRITVVGHLRRACCLAASALLLSQTSLYSQQTGPWARCNTDSLSNYNCAQYYSGTVSLNSELKTADGTEIWSVAAVVTAGRVVCKVKHTGDEDIEGPGMLVVEHESNMNAGGYIIRVWCPQNKGERPTRRDSPVIDTYDQRSNDYAKLEGKDTHEHPDADAANGVSGTETIAWQLHR